MSTNELLRQSHHIISPLIEKFVNEKNKHKSIKILNDKGKLVVAAATKFKTKQLPIPQEPISS